MKKITVWLLSLLVAIFAFPALAAGPTKTYYKGGVTKVEKVSAKATRVEAQSCLGTAFWSTVPKDGVPTAVSALRTYFVTPASCMENDMGVGFDGAWSLEYKGAFQGLSIFEATPLMDEFIVPPSVADARVGTQVYVYDDQEMRIIIGKDTVFAAPGANTYLSAYIAGEVGYANRRTAGNCGPSGCAGMQEELGYGYAMLDKAFSVPPGTAVLDESGQTVGMIIGADRGKTLFVRSYAVFSLLVRLGVIEGGKG